MSKALRRLRRPFSRLSRSLRSGRDRLVEAFARGALWSLGRLSLAQALQLGEWLGTLGYRLLKGPRSLAFEQLQIAFGDRLGPRACEHLVRASFVNAARTFCEIARIEEIHQRHETYIDTEGWEHLEKLRARGGGCIVLTGPIGNWELLVAYLAWRGIPVAAVTRRVYVKRLNQLLVGFRQRQGVETILRESPNSARQILRALKSDAVLAMVIDQGSHVPSVAVPFFGQPARTPMAAAALAMRRQLPVLAAFMQRSGDWGCRVVIRPPIEIHSSGDAQADIRALTAQFNGAIEAQICANPAEWLWWHRRGRRGPLGCLDLGVDIPYTGGTAVEHGQT